MMQGDLNLAQQLLQVNGSKQLECKTFDTDVFRIVHHQHHIILLHFQCGSSILTCDCQTSFLAQDCTILVLSKALIEPFI